MTELEQQILTAIRASGTGWQTRVQIAERIGQQKLTGYGATVLEALTYRGLIESRKSLEGAIHPYYEYRATQKI
jgi:hypothetical protein